MRPRALFDRGRLLSRVGVLVACCLPLSCSHDDRVDLTLRVRDGYHSPELGPAGRACFDVPEESQVVAGAGSERHANPATWGCHFQYTERYWSDGSGQSATVPAYAATAYYTGTSYSTVECGGRSIASAWWWTLLPDRDPQSDSFKLQLADGTTAVLDPVSGLWAETAPADDACSEVTGTWRGIEGSLRDHHGSFTMINDSLQTTLHLAED